jgi:hypothetical protein
MLKFALRDRLKLLKQGIPFIIAQYHPLAFDNLEIPFWKSLLTLKVFATKLFPETVTQKKEMEWFKLNAPGSYIEVNGFVKSGAYEYNFSMNLARVNEFSGITPEINFFKGFLEPQKVENDVLKILGTGLDQSFRYNSFIEPPKALIIGLTGFFPTLFHVMDIEFELKDFNSYNNPTIGTVKIKLKEIQNSFLSNIKQSFDKFNDLLFSTFVSDLREWTVDRSTYQGNVFGLIMEFLDSFENSGLSGEIIGIFNGLLTDAGRGTVRVDDGTEVKIYNMTKDIFLANMIKEGFENKFIKKGPGKF